MGTDNLPDSLNSTASPGHPQDPQQSMPNTTSTRGRAHQRLPPPRSPETAPIVRPCPTRHGAVACRTEQLRGHGCGRGLWAVGRPQLGGGGGRLCSYRNPAAWKGLCGELNLVLLLLKPGCPWRPNPFWGFKSLQLAKEEASSRAEAMPASHFNWSVLALNRRFPKSRASPTVPPGTRDMCPLHEPPRPHQRPVHMGCEVPTTVTGEWPPLLSRRGCWVVRGPATNCTKSPIPDLHSLPVSESTLPA